MLDTNFFVHRQSGNSLSLSTLMRKQKTSSYCQPLANLCRFFPKLTKKASVLPKIFKFPFDQCNRLHQPYFYFSSQPLTAFLTVLFNLIPFHVEFGLFSLLNSVSIPFIGLFIFILSSQILSLFLSISLLVLNELVLFSTLVFQISIFTISSIYVLFPVAANSTSFPSSVFTCLRVILTKLLQTFLSILYLYTSPQWAPDYETFGLYLTAMVSICDRVFLVIQGVLQSLLRFF